MYIAASTCVAITPSVVSSNSDKCLNKTSRNDACESWGSSWNEFCNFDRIVWAAK